MTCPGETPDRIPLGISACLLGEPVRYDGGHKRQDFIVERLGPYVAFVPCCPETAIGMGVPRPPLRLQRTARGVRARGVEDPSRDFTEALAACARQTAARQRQICGYVFKSRSPSCGLHDAEIYHEQTLSTRGSGIYARALRQALPALPVEDEVGLMDPQRRRRFLERVVFYSRWRRLQSEGMGMGDLVDFHRRLECTVLSRSQAGWQELEALMARADSTEPGSLAQRYVQSLMRVLAEPDTGAGHAAVLYRLLGEVESRLGPGETEALDAAIGACREGRGSCLEPRKQLRSLLRPTPAERWARQYYLNPHPLEGV